jgi:hypothetical protein
MELEDELREMRVDVAKVLDDIDVDRLVVMLEGDVEAVETVMADDVPVKIDDVTVDLAMLSAVLVTALRRSLVDEGRYRSMRDVEDSVSRLTVCRTSSSSRAS